ncbi:MAG: TolC family protein [Gammaproteobacteria bacterium]|nr:TolC family protein [Gammaproteobacteria bacterium]
MIPRAVSRLARLVASVFMLWSGAGAALELTIKDAETVAVQKDPMIVKFQAGVAASMEEAIADQALPDPRLKLGAMNLPLDGFSLTQEPMTQMVIGVQQMLPSWGLLDLKHDAGLIKAEVHRAQAMTRALMVLRMVRKGWMDVYYYTHSQRLVKESQEVFSQLVKITQFQYRAGRGKQQDVVRAQLELSMLQDREAMIEQQREAAIANMEKWIGASVKTHTLSTEFPQLPELPPIEELSKNVEFHPSVAVAKAQLGVARTKVAIAKAKYKPSFMLDVSYGWRGGYNTMGEMQTPRADFVSAMVSMDMPFFTSKRQDKRLNARGHELNAASDAINNQRRELQQILDTSYANWVRLGERMEFYQKTVLLQAAQFSETSRKAYQSRVSDFSELVKARLGELNNNLQALKIRTDRAKAHYDLQYIAGESSS